MNLTLSEAEVFVENNPNAKWDGWNIMLYTPNPNAFMRKAAGFHNGQWCLKATIAPNQEGRYVIGKKQANDTRKSRS